MTENALEQSVRRKPWWNIWTNYHDEVRHLQIDYSVREREKQLQKIVDDNGFKFMIFFVAASGFLASSYSLFATNVVMPSLFYVYPPCGRLSDNASDVIDLLTFIGAVVGMVSMGHLADRSGRKRLYGLELAILIIATMGVVQASEGFMADNPDGTYDHSMDIYAWISWWRFILGIGIGAEYPLSAIITAEWASTESRGTMLVAVSSMQSVSRLLAFATSLGAIRDSNLASDTTIINESKLVVDRAWRLTIGVGVIPAAIAIILRLTIPETPRYYADIMKDLRKAVKNALKMYGRNRKVTELNSINSGPSRQNSDEENDQWYRGAWNYLTGPKKAWRNLVSISVLWGIMDAAWYGLSMDNSSVLSTLAHDPSDGSSSFNFKVKRSDNSTCNDLWNTDLWNPSNTIDEMLQDNSIRSILIVSIASLLGSIAAIVIINRFRRKSILVTTFLLLSLLFAVSGGSLIGTDRAGENHIVTTVFYAILQFIFNLGPKALIFVLAAEIFPTVYRGTFYGIAAACGKIGAICIRAIIGRTGNQEMSLGIRLLVFIPLMLLAAWISTILPDVQYVPKTIDAEALVGQQTGSEREKRPQVTEEPASGRNQQQVLGEEDQVQRACNDSSSDKSSSHEPERSQPGHGSQLKVHFLGRLKNKALEDIAPNPS